MSTASASFDDGASPSQAVPGHGAGSGAGARHEKNALGLGSIRRTLVVFLTPTLILGTALSFAPTPTIGAGATEASTSGPSSGFPDLVPLGFATADDPQVVGSLPIVEGVVRVGETVTVQPGIWEPVPVDLAYQWLLDGEEVPGATTTSFTIAPEHRYRMLAVRVTGTKPGFAGQTIVSEATMVNLGKFIPVSAPQITGSAEVGQTLTVSPGTWNVDPAIDKYVWCIVGPGRGPGGRPDECVHSGLDYKVEPVAAGERLYVKQWADIFPGYLPENQDSAAIEIAALPLFDLAPEPIITGEFKVGSLVIAHAGDWAPTPETLSYQWFRDGESIPGATGESYTPVDYDIHRDLSVRVEAVKGGLKTTRARSVSLRIGPRDSTPSPVFDVAPKPTLVLESGGSAPAPVRSGTKLTARTGDWSPEPDAFEYWWLRDGRAIDGAKSASYTTVPNDAGKRITVMIAARKNGYPETWRTSASLAVAPLPATVKRLTATPRPRIAVFGGGRAKAGKKLAVKAGSWKPYKVTLSYRWLRNGKAIKGATKSKYKLTRKDRGKRISVRVTGKKPGYVTVSKTSSAKRVARTR